MPITHQKVSKNNFFIFCEIQRFPFRIFACHFHDSISMDVGTFMICSFGTVLLLGDHKLSKVMSVVKGSLLTF